MECQIQQDARTKIPEKILAPNGEPSILYEHLKKALPDDYQPDLFTLAFYDQGNIKGFSNAEAALALWVKINAMVHDTIINPEEIRLDKNGEPVFQAILEHLHLPRLSENYFLSGDLGAEVFIRNLVDKGLIQKMGEDYQVTDTVSLPDSEHPGMRQPALKIAETLKWLGIPRDFVSFQKKGNLTTVRFHNERFYVTERITDYHDQVNTRFLIGYLADRFPQLKFHFVNEEEAKEMYEKLPELSTHTDFDQVNSFVYKGDVYLIQGRVTDRVAIEETLHPFIYTISKTNRPLFDQLYEAAQTDFPELDKEIKSRYIKKEGFTDEDRQLELVTQALTQVYAQEVSANERKSIKAVLPRLFEWLKNLIQEIGEVLSGKKAIEINAKDLPSSLTLSELAKALNTYDSTFLIDDSSLRASFSLSEEREALKRRVLKTANPLQRKVIEDLFHPHNPVLFDTEQKAYVNTKGEPYTSLTTAINGRKKDLEAKDGLRKLFGKNARHVLELMAIGEKFDDIKDRIDGASLGIAAKAYKELQRNLNQYLTEGSILMPYMVAADSSNKVASTLDLLILHPDGRLALLNLKVSADSVWDKEKYEHQTAPVGSSSKLKGEALSQRQEQSIRANALQRLLENSGYIVDQNCTLYVHVPKEKLDYSVKIEDTQIHSPFDNRGLVNKILPVVPQNAEDKIERYKNELQQDNPVNNPNFLTEEEQMPEEPLQEPIDHLTVDHERLAQERKNLADKIDGLVRAVKNKPKSVMVQKFSTLLEFVQHELTKGESSLAYGKFLRTSQEELDNVIRYLSDDTKVGDDEYARVAIEAGWYLKTYEGIANAFHLAIGNSNQAAKLTELLQLLDATNSRIQLSLEKYILHQIRTVSKKELTDNDFADLIKEAVDITKHAYYFNDTATSTDTLIAVADKLYKRQRIKAMDRMAAFDKDVKARANELAARTGGKTDMSQFIEEGTGRYVQEIGSPYWKLLDAAEQKIKTADGIMRQYRDITSLADARPADIEYNKTLYRDKEGLRKFKEAEVLTENGPQEGMYHRYNDEFTNERARHQQYKVIVDDEGNFIKGAWERKKNEDGKYATSDAAYHQFQRKYYQEVVYDKPVFEDGEFTGMILKHGGKDWFVKEDYIEVRKVAGDGTDMVSAKWRALSNDTSEAGRARWEFYQYYTQKMEETLKMLPPNVYRNMLGKLPRVRANFMERAKKSPSFLRAVAKTITNWFSVRTYARAAMLNEDGTTLNQIPVFFTGSLRNEQLIDQLKQDIEQLDQDYKNNRVSRTNYLEERKEKTEELRAAEKSIAHNEINTNLAESLIAFRAMAENYMQMNDIEGAMNATLRILEQRVYKKQAEENKLRTNPATGEPYELKAGAESYAFRRFKKWMDMVFYNSQDLDTGTFDVVAKKLMSVSSLVNVGFNSFGAIHNYLMARINTVVESAGAQFYTRSAARDTFIEFQRDLLPGFFRHLGSKEGPYKIKKPGSKYEAAVQFFHIYRPQQSGDHRINIETPGFILMEAGEYSAQTKSGIAYLKSHDLQHRRTDNIENSIYNALEFNKETGALTWKAGLNLDPTTKLDITNSIWEMNKQVHGNYTWEDRMVIQQQTMGQIAAQFHKWLYPAYKSLFQARYFDENLGWMEGRFRTLYHLVQYMYRAQGSFLEKWRAGFRNLDEIQIKNMYRNAASIGFFILSFAAYGLFRSLAGNTDDDDKNAKRWLNFLSTESDRIKDEIAIWLPVEVKEKIRLIKNPFAIGPTIDQFAGIIGEGFKLAMPPYDDDVYYTHGPFEGELRFKKKLFDVLPIMKDINKWQSFSQVTNFYIK